MSAGSGTRNIEEFLRRKRAAKTTGKVEDGESAFKSSLMTMRSPEREKGIENKIDELGRIVIEMEGRIGEKLESFIKKEFTRWKMEQREREEEWKREREEIREEIREIKRRLEKMEREREEARREIEEQKETRKSNKDKGLAETEMIRKTMEKWKEEGEREKRKRN